MAQFQVYRNQRPSRAQVPYLLDVQSDLVDIGTRLVAPLVLMDAFGTRLTRLHPEFSVAGAALVMSTADLAGLPLRDMGDWVADLTPRREVIMAAIDFLLLGY